MVFVISDGQSLVCGGRASWVVGYDLNSVQWSHGSGDGSWRLPAERGRERTETGAVVGVRRSDTLRPQ